MAARVRAARANEELLKHNLERERALVARNAGTQAVVDDLQAQLNGATANRQALEQELAAAKKGAREPEIESADARANAASRTVAMEDEQIERRVLRSPIAGVVLDVHVDPGEVISAGTPILTLGDTARPYVDVFVPVGQLSGIHVGSKAKVRVDASDRQFDAHVDWIAQTTEFTPRFLFSDQERPNLVIRVRLIIDDTERQLYAGVPAFATIDKEASP
jgi:HlyD family secretion protein